MPSGRVRFFDADKGFGFIAKDDGGDEVYVHASGLPDGVETLKKGQRVEFGLIEGRRGEQAISVRLLDAPVSLSKQTRRSSEAMALMNTLIGCALKRKVWIRFWMLVCSSVWRLMSSSHLVSCPTLGSSPKMIR